jgi:DNA (cytosine-5)-methyltransferase 1
VNTLQCNTGDQRTAIAIQTANTGANGKNYSKEVSSTLDRASPPAVAVHGTQDPCTSKDVAFALGRNSGQENALYRDMQVRRLTPEECEALQGFPRGFTRIPWKAGFYWGKEDMPPEAMQACAEQCPNGPRYKALGNSMAVNCMEWIGLRIQHIERITQ